MNFKLMFESSRKKTIGPNLSRDPKTAKRQNDQIFMSN